MDRIDIFTATSYDVLPILKRILPPNWKCLSVCIDYNCNTIGASEDDSSEKWPFKATFVNERGKVIELRVFTFAIGYGGTGPHDAAKILQYLGVHYDRDDIFTRCRQSYDGVIHLKYTV
jgi:hypothetical protein